MSVCSTCGHENQPAAKFCSECGVALVENSAAMVEERKIVTVLFADLVGFTARAELMDPEDVRGLLAPYHARLRSELERFGGTVEKFIGDAVMALFGAPVSHEDDPERAVRAALAIRDWVREQDEELQLRIAVNTGEALIALGARPEAGEGMASGDVVNTTARLQSKAPVNGILVGETTYRATRDVIDYGERNPIEAKGKAAPTPVWEALEARARFGLEVEQRSATPLVGRDAELGDLVAALARARRDRTPQLVTLVGVPGIGKSRLVYELMEIVEGESELTYWRQGRCLPYGEGVTFWALAEMVKAQAGILETDDADAAAGKLHEAVLVTAEDDAEALRLERHLRPLVGLSAVEEIGGEGRGDAFFAWRRFFERLAEQRPLVLVFEDVQWADDALLDFADHLVDWAGDVPLLVLCTARPELLGRRPGWGGGKPNATTLSLSALSDDETARLLGSVLERSVLPADEQQELLARAGGNPLYAEQFARMRLERGDGDEFALPETVQGIIAARLDGLGSEEKAVLQDAAVLGKVFWLGAVATLSGGRPNLLEQRLHSLERKEFLRRERRSSVAGETEYAFRHVLVRDVAYGQIPRAGRAEKHRGAAKWIESLGRPEEHAEMLAHHYLSALDFASAVGQDTSMLNEPARRALDEAGVRALSLNAFAPAARFFARAVELCPRSDPSRPHLLLRYGRALFHSEQAGDDVLREASETLNAAGDFEGAAEAEAALGEFCWFEGSGEAEAHLHRASEFVQRAPPSRSKAQVLATVGRFALLAGRHDESVSANRAALEIAERLGLEDIRVQALHYIGLAKSHQGDPQGLAEVEESVRLAESVGPALANRTANNLADALYEAADLARACPLFEECLRRSEQIGNLEQIRFQQGIQAYSCWEQGRWEEALACADSLIADVEAGASHYHETAARLARAFISLARGDEIRALADAARALEQGRAIGDPQVLLACLGGAVRIHVDVGRFDDANAMLTEWLALYSLSGAWLTSYTAILAAAMHRLGRGAELGAVLDTSPRTRWAEAAGAHARNDPAVAASIYASFGAAVHAAEAHLLATEQLVIAGKRTEAFTHLQKALDFYRPVHATRYTRAGEALLAAAS